MSYIVCLSVVSDSMKVFCTLGGCAQSFSPQCVGGCRYINVEIRNSIQEKNDVLGKFLVLTLAQEV